MPIHIPIDNQDLPQSIPVNSRYKTIYILRAQCEKHALDKMDVFYLIPNATVPHMYRKLRSAIRKAFPKKYGCRHKIRFIEETETEHRWDTKLNKAVEVTT